MPGPSVQHGGVEAVRGLVMRHVLWSLIVLVLAGGPGLSTASADDEPIGRWRYKLDDRTQKVVVIGGSISAWRKGSFSQFLGAVCANAEIVNRSKTGYGAFALKKRFDAQFLKNWNVKLKDERFSYWLVYSGGLNSIYSPEKTILHTVDTFRRAHRRGVRVIALSLTPWGDFKDKRWRGWSGLTYRNKTRKYVDYVLRKLTRNDALGSYAHRRGVETWQDGELPEVGIDLYDSPLRAADSERTDTTILARHYDRKRALRAKFPEREAALRDVSDVPRWFLRKELRSFDHIHPNTQGHRLIAETACPALPAEWRCDCQALKTLSWKKGSVVSVPPKEGAASSPYSPSPSSSP